MGSIQARTSFQIFVLRVGAWNMFPEGVKSKKLIVVTILNGIYAKLFGHWIRANNNGNLLFINVPEEDDLNSTKEDGVRHTEELARITKDKQIEYRDGQNSCKDVIHRNVEAEYENTKMMCLQLNTLDLSLKL